MIPPRPFRLRILDNMTKVFERIGPATDHPEDMAGRVFRGRIRYGDNDPISMISILEAPIPLETIRTRGAVPVSSGDWELLVQGFVKDDLKNPTDPAHVLMAQAKKVLIVEKTRDNGFAVFDLGPKSPGRKDTGNCIMEMTVGQGSVRPPEDASSKAFFWLIVTLKLAENLNDPYS